MIPKAEATRLRIIEAAADLMGTRGYSRTGVEGHPGAHQHLQGKLLPSLPSKEDLGFAVLDHLGDGSSTRSGAGWTESRTLFCGSMRCSRR